MTPWDAVCAIPLAVLPRRYWDDWDLPVLDMVLVSSFATLFGGAALGITGFFTHMSAILGSREWTAPPLMMPAFFGYVFFTPRGLFSLYLAISGLVRCVSWYIDEPHGDPLLTGIDALVRGRVKSRRETKARTEREMLEGADEPDRRYDGEWAGLTGVDFVIVSARRKAGWTKGTWVTTPDGWYTLGEPFDRPTPNGLRTVYPLSAQNTLEVVRKSVAYELPALRRPAKAAPART